MSLYGLILGIAFVLCFEIFSRKNDLIPKKEEWWFFLGLIVSSIIGARTYHIIDQWSYYSQHIWQIFNTRGGGLGIMGGIAGGFLFILVYSVLKKINLIKITDTVAQVLPLGQAIGRFGNFTNHEVYSPSGFPVWAMESVLDFILYLILRLLKHSHTAFYLIGYGAIRFLSEFFRNDTWVMGNIKVSQTISLIFIFIGCLLLLGGKKQK